MIQRVVPAPTSRLPGDQPRDIDTATVDADPRVLLGSDRAATPKRPRTIEVVVGGWRFELEVEVTGIQTTLPFHRFVATHPGFAAGEIGIGWVDAEWEPVARSLRDAALDVAARAVAVAATTPAEIGRAHV